MFSAPPSPGPYALSLHDALPILGNRVTPAVADQVQEQFPEIADERREERQYPAGTTGASVIGAASWSVDDRKRSEEHTSELQSPCNLVCRPLLVDKDLYDDYVQR